ncbi:MAG: AMP-binding protein, partial [Algicola sp.]|nr:AMP-binding protein [Algicola sp.]
MEYSPMPSAQPMYHKVSLIQPFALHPAQQDVYFSQLLRPQSPTYNIGWYTVAQTNLDLALLQQSWRLLYRHVDALRLQIITADDVLPMQIVKAVDTECVLVETADFSNQTQPFDAALLWIEQQIEKTSAYLDSDAMRVVLIRLGEQQSMIFTCIHHLMIDGMGCARLHQLLQQTYQCLQNGESTAWMQHIPQYENVVNKAQVYLASERYQKNQAYWQHFCQSRQLHRLIPHSGEKPLQDNGPNGHRSMVNLPQSLGVDLRRFCHLHQVSPLVLLAAVTGLYFARINAVDVRDEVVMSTTVHGRDQGPAMDVIGMHANVIALGCRVELAMTFLGLVEQLKRNLAQGREHRQFPTSHLARLLPDGQAATADIQVIYDALDQGDDKSGDNQLSNGLLTSLFDVSPLTIRLMDSGADNGFTLKIIHHTRYFDKAQGALLVQRLSGLMAQGLADSSQVVGHMALMSKKERSTVIHQFNSQHPNPKSAPPLQTLHQKFEAQVAQTPNNLALVFAGQSLSYGELNDQANQLAALICCDFNGLEPDTLVALYLDRSLEMVVAILAVLKAGGAYVPISPDTPQIRTQFVLDDTQALILLTHSKYKARFVDCATKLLTVDDVTLRGYATANLAVKSAHCTHNNLAYVIYTSGTTGQPKGVMIEHGGVVSLIAAQTKAFDFTAQEKVLWLASYAFDAAVEQLFLPLLNGAIVVIASQAQIQDAAQIKRDIVALGITHLHGTPEYLAALGEIT